MFDILLERSSGEGPSSAGPSGAGLLALSVLFGYTVVATIVAGGFAVPAGLFVFALGCLATVVVDHAYWRETAFAPTLARAEPPPGRLALAATQVAATQAAATQAAETRAAETRAAESRAALPAPPARETLDAPTPDGAAQEGAQDSAQDSAQGAAQASAQDSAVAEPPKA